MKPQQGLAISQKMIFQEDNFVGDYGVGNEVLDVLTYDE